MPNIRCVACGIEINFDQFSLPYDGEVACPDCKTPMDVYFKGSQKGVTVKRKYPSYEELTPVWDSLEEIEQTSIDEASRALGSGAYTASELISLRTLEAILKRIYNPSRRETLFRLIQRVERDDRLADLSDVLSYFRKVRNRVAHPEKISKELDAKSTFLMTKRLVLEILEKLGQ